MFVCLSVVCVILQLLICYKKSISHTSAVPFHSAAEHSAAPSVSWEIDKKYAIMNISRDGHNGILFGLNSIYSIAEH